MNDMDRSFARSSGCYRHCRCGPFFFDVEARQLSRFLLCLAVLDLCIRPYTHVLALFLGLRKFAAKRHDRDNDINHLTVSQVTKRPIQKTDESKGGQNGGKTGSQRRALLRCHEAFRSPGFVPVPGQQGRS